MPFIPATPINSTNFPDALDRGLREVIFNNYAERVKQYEPLFNIRGSVKFRERDLIQGGLGQLVPFGEGQAPELDSGAEAWVATYIHEQFGLRLIVTRVAQQDELYGIVGRYGGELTRAAIYTQEIQAMTTFNSLSATIYSPREGGNYPLLATNQYRIDGGTWSNKLSSGADLSIESLEALMVQWHDQMVDLRGRKIATEPVKLVVGTNDKFVAERLVNSIQRPGTANNDPNSPSVRGLEVHVMSHMTNDGRWFLLGDTPQTGLHWFNRVSLEVQRETPGDGTGNLMMVVYGRWSSGASHVWNIAGSS